MHSTINVVFKYQEKAVVQKYTDPKPLLVAKRLYKEGSWFGVV